MTAYPTRRAAREASQASARAEHGFSHARAQASGRAARTSSHATHRAPAKRWRSPGRMTAAGAAALFLAGSAMVAMPANAASLQAGTVYSNQLLGGSQTLTVAASVKSVDVEQLKFDSAGFTRPDGSPAITVGGLTNIDWAALVLQDGKFPVTQNNLTVLLQWMDSENDPNSWWLRNNPLNNGLGSGGGAGLGSYDNLTIAAGYVAEQLRRDLFSGIAAALDADSPVATTAQAIIDSSWAGGHYDYGAIWHAVDVPIVAAPAEDW